MEWETIDSAPKDGTKILIAWKDKSDRGVCVGFWSEEVNYWQGDDYYNITGEPTHYMPLPKPPVDIT